MGEQLWDYEEARSSGIFRSKTGLVADMKGSVGPELICWPHHGGPNQKFEIKDDFFIHCEIDDRVWDVKGGRLTPGGPLILWPKHGGPNQQFRWKGKQINWTLILILFLFLILIPILILILS